MVSPRDYAELIFPYEYEICQAAKQEGLFALVCFLGCLSPVIEKVMELPRNSHE